MLPKSAAVIRKGHPLPAERRHHHPHLFFDLDPVLVSPKIWSPKWRVPNMPPHHPCWISPLSLPCPFSVPPLSPPYPSSGLSSIPSQLLSDTGEMVSLLYFASPTHPNLFPRNGIYLYLFSSVLHPYPIHTSPILHPYFIHTSPTMQTSRGCGLRTMVHDPVSIVTVSSNSGPEGPGAAPSDG
jgi:hypothetical protein